MKKVYILFLILLSLSIVKAQNASDKIIAVIGNKIILASDIDNIILDAKRNNQPLPENASCVLLETILIQKLLSLQAERDSLPITEDEIQTEMDNRIRRMTQVYGSKAMLEEIAGQSIGELKKDMHDMFKEQLLAKAMQNKVVSNVRFTPKEVKDCFNATSKDSLPFYEEEVEVGSIVIYPESSPDLDRYIINQLTEYRQQILAKRVSFSMLAERESEDPSVVENKGIFELNINDKQMWDPTFFTAAFKLKKGQISPVIKSKF
ncbi:MAG: peptidylprolyl isomerase, partial [Chitinophagaceae bacterium]